MRHTRPLGNRLAPSETSRRRGQKKNEYRSVYTRALGMRPAMPIGGVRGAVGIHLAELVDYGFDRPADDRDLPYLVQRTADGESADLFFIRCIGACRREDRTRSEGP